MRLSLLPSLAAASLATMFAAAPVSADFDLSPVVGPGNRIVTDAFQDDSEELVSNVRVFGYAFGETPGQPLFLPDPGFHPLPGSGFAEGSSIGFDLAAPLQYWDGTGTPTFANVAGGASMRFDFGANSVVSTGGGVPSPAGYLFGAVDENGEFDDHLETYLLASGGTIENPGTPAEGIYLATMRVTSSASNVAASEPAYLLFANGAEDALIGAQIAVRDARAPGTNLAGIPEPTTLTLIAASGAMLTKRRRH